MLAELQKGVMDALLRGDDAVARALRGSDALSPGQRLAIYRDSITATHCKALAELFPVCKRVVGEAFFDAICRAYMRVYPPASPSLDDYGASLPDFLTGFAPARQLPYLPDLARLEWSRHLAFIAADETAPDLEALVAVPDALQGQIVFRLPASASLLESPYPVHRIWEANQSQDEPETVDLDSGGVRLLVWRDDQGARMEVPNSALWELLRALERGTTLDELLAGDLAAMMEQGLEAAVRRGWIAGFHVEDGLGTT